MTLKRINRSLSPAERAEHRRIREQIEGEKPAIVARLKARRKAMAQLGSQLRNLREQKNLSLRDVAEVSGIDASALAKLETGKRDNCTLETLERLASALGKRVVVALVDD